MSCYMLYGVCLLSREIWGVPEVLTHSFQDGTTKTEGFLAHKPSTKLRGNLAQQLELPLTPMNTIVVSPPFNQTRYERTPLPVDPCF